MVQLPLRSFAHRSGLTTARANFVWDTGDPPSLIGPQHTLHLTGSDVEIKPRGDVKELQCPEDQRGSSRTQL
jgi:hypothetical protein